MREKQCPVPKLSVVIFTRCTDELIAVEHLCCATPSKSAQIITDQLRQTQGQALSTVDRIGETERHRGGVTVGFTLSLADQEFSEEISKECIGS